MSIDSPSRGETQSPHPDKLEVINYGDILRDAQAPEAKKPAEVDPTRADYDLVAGRIAKSFDYYLRQPHEERLSLSEIVHELKDVYCEGVENQTQRGFNELIIDTLPAYRQSLYMHQLRQQIDTGQADRTRKDQHHQLVYAICEYDHKLRDVIAAGRTEFDRADITRWLAQAGGGSPRAMEFAKFAVNGVISEITVMDALLDGDPQALSTFAEVPRDLKGTDIDVSDSQGSFTIDVKSHHGQAMPYWRAGKPHLIVNVDPLDMEDINPKPAVLKRMYADIMQARRVAMSSRERLGDYIPPHRRTGDQDWAGRR